MKFKGLFSKYAPLSGRDWIRSIPAEERAVFSYLGRAAGKHGRTGGLALKKLRGRKYFKTLGHDGGIASAKKRAEQKLREAEE